MKRSVMMMILGGLMLGGTPAAAGDTKDGSAAGVDHFRQCADVRDYLAEAYSISISHSLSYPRYDRWGYGGDGIMAAEASGSAPAASPRAAEASKASTAGPSTHTTTNVQEVGVDENDTVKTDGRFVYAVSGQVVTIVKSWPVEEAAVVATIDLGEHVTPQSLFLRGDRLVVFSSISEPATPTKSRPSVRRHHYDAPPRFAGTRVSVVDIADRSAPKVERQEDYEGWMNQARLIGSDVYLVFNSYLQGPDGLWDLDQYGVKQPTRWLDEKEQRRFLARIHPKVMKQVRAKLDATPLRDLLPEHRVVRGDGRIVARNAAISCQDLVRSARPSTSILGVAHLDIDNPNDHGATGLFGDGWTVYASTENLYVAGTTWGWAWGAWWGTEEVQDHWYKTQVHKFRMRGKNGQPEYAASGQVDGWLLNQFSMSEWGDHLRVGTTDWNIPGTTEGGNHLTVLAERDGKLVQTGAARGLAPGERIFSMRMVGDIGYMVTFRQTDPLYTIDLADPTNPRVLGELKINGFSSYIHPLGPDHLLTVGQDATDDGRVLGLHLQIFDVTDLANPRRIHHRRITEERWSSWSPAMWDHHAFTFDAARKLLVLPVMSYQPEPFSGAMVLKADPNTGFEDYGFLTQESKTGRDFCERAFGGPNSDYRSTCEPYSLLYQVAIQRSIIVDDYVLALSALGLTAHPLRTPHETLASVYTYVTPKAYAY